MHWWDLLAVQGTLKSLLQHHSSKASVLWNSDFFILQLSHPYMTTGKTIALTRWTFVDKVMSLLACFFFFFFFFFFLVLPVYCYQPISLQGFPGDSDGKASAYNAGDPGSIPGLGRSSGEGNGNPLQYSCLENPMDGGDW